MKKDKKQVEGRLIEAGLRLAGQIVSQGVQNDKYYVFIYIKRGGDGKQSPSNQSLKKIKNELEKIGILIDYILIDENRSDIESGMRATLLISFPSIVRNAFITSKGNKYTVWVDLKKAALSDAEGRDVAEKASAYLENMGLVFEGLQLANGANVPTRTAILGMLRIIAPADVERLVSKAEEEGFERPPIEYMSRHLDALRKSKLVLRKKDASYALTARALKMLGSSKRRNSPDIQRVLDLARRS